MLKDVDDAVAHCHGWSEKRRKKGAQISKFQKLGGAYTRMHALILQIQNCQRIVRRGCKQRLAGNCTICFQCNGSARSAGQYQRQANSMQP